MIASIKDHRKKLLDEENRVIAALAAFDEALRLLAPHDYPEARQAIDALDKAGAKLEARIPWRP